MRPWLLALLLAACAPAADSGVHQLRFATPYPPQHPFSRADKTWIEHVEAQSGGRLRIIAHWSGSLLSSDQSLVELRHGVADVGAILPIYARGGAHALKTQAAFYAGAPDFAAQVQVYKCLAQRFSVFQRELADLQVLAVQGGSLPGVVTRSRALHRLGDLAGLRLRAPSELMEVLRALGADPVNMPMSDVYAALAKGVIDGVVAPPDSLRSLHLADVARIYTELAIPRGAYPSRAIRRRALQALPVELQQLLLGSGALWESALAREVARAQQGGRSYAAERGMTWNSLPEAEQRAFDRAYNLAARSQARALEAHGQHGDAMFQSAQRAVDALRHGQPACSGG